MPLLDNIKWKPAVPENDTEDTTISETANTSVTVTLDGGPPWGFRLQGGQEFEEPLSIAKVSACVFCFIL